MVDITHKQMLEALIEEKRLADQYAEEARRRAVDARTDAERLQGAVAAIQALIPALESVRQTIDLRSNAAAATEAFTQSFDSLRTAATVVPAGQDEDDDEDTDRKRVPSTKWAAEIVIDARRTMTREEVQDEFARRHGIPAAWADPIASISVALNRASQKGIIVRTGRATYAPPGQTTDVESEELAMAD